MKGQWTISRRRVCRGPRRRYLPDAPDEIFIRLIESKNKVPKMTHDQVLIFNEAPGKHTRTLDTSQDNKGVQK